MGKSYNLFMPLRVVVDLEAPDLASFEQARHSLRAGLVVAFPTDTLYGLAVNPWNSAAVEQLYRIKRRTSENAMPLVAADVAQIERAIGSLSRMARSLARIFWPGPLTLIIDADPALALALHAAERRVAVRVPAHAVARGLARAAGHPLTATSANRSGEPPATSADEVIATFGDEIAVVLDAGPTPGGAPSTIVDATGGSPILVRAGAIPWNRVLESLR